MNLKPEFQTKFLQYLHKQKRGDEGFTLIELLVVIIIIGILAAIALPSLLSQANKGKQAEARQNVGALVRAQQAYLLEAGSFSTVIANLGLGLSSATVNYTYIINGAGGTPAEDKHDFVGNNATPNNRSLKAYVGVVGTGLIGEAATATEAAAIGFVCESEGVSQGTFASGTGDPLPLFTPTVVTTEDFTNLDCEGTAPGKVAITQPPAPYDAWENLGG